MTETHVPPMSLRALQARHPQLRWTRHVGTHGASHAYRGVGRDYAVTIVPYVQDCREGQGVTGAPGGDPTVADTLRKVPRYLWLQQSNSGDPQSLYTGTLHGEIPRDERGRCTRCKGSGIVAGPGEYEAIKCPMCEGAWRPKLAVNADGLPYGTPQEVPSVVRGLASAEQVAIAWPPWKRRAAAEDFYVTHGEPDGMNEDPLQDLIDLGLTEEPH